MEKLTTKLREFLMDVVSSDLNMKDIFGDDAWLFQNFEFAILDIEDPTDEEKARVKRVCETAAQKAGQSIELDDEDLVEIWKRGVQRHYERSYMDDYYERLIIKIEEKVQDSFRDLTDFFDVELAEAGLPLETIPPFKVSLDWANDGLTIEGNLSALEVILIELINGYGMFGYDNLEEFRALNVSNQEQRILGHLHYLHQIESIYGTIYDFFHVRGLSDLDRYYMFGDLDVTDDELIEAMEDY